MPIMSLPNIEIIVISALLAMVSIVLIMLWRQRRRHGCWPGWTGLADKTLWDLVAILVVPAVLSGGALAYGSLDARYQLQLESRREDAQREIDTNRINEEILQSYFDDMSDLILDHDLRAETLGHHGIQSDSSAPQDIARARTLAVLSILDGKRNGILLRFLLETDLFPLIKNERLGINLQDSVITEVDLSGASLNRSDLRKATLVRNNFSDAVFIDANLEGANLIGADLSQAALFRANLRGAILSDATLTDAFYDDSTIWPDEFEPSEAGAVKTTLEQWAAETQ